MDDGMIEKLSEEWALSSNEALKLSLVDEAGTELAFSPAFTYPIYGDSEVVYGYKDLAINLQFDAHSLLPHLAVTWSAKLPADGIPDPKEIILKYLPESTVLKDQAEWEKKRKEAAELKIPGEAVATFTDATGAGFTVYKSKFSDPAAKELHDRIQILILLFIEAGSYIDSSDDHWELYTLYKTSPSSDKEEKSDKPFRPVFAGFSTIYNYFWYADAESYDKPNGTDPYTPYIRKRVSQFVVLPTYQGKQVGGKFYSALFDTFYKDAHIKEISVEDPSEAFDDLRDRCDLTRLVANSTAASIYATFSAEKTVARDVISETGAVDAFTLAWIHNKRCENKMSVRQFDRCIEMILLYYLENVESVPATAVKRFRLLVKRRLYLRNRDALDDMPPEEKKSKLQETFEALKDDYWRIIGKVTFPIEKRKAADSKNKGKGIKKQRV